MDTLKIIRNKAKVLYSLVPESGLLAVVRHIEIAEAHFSRAQKEGDKDLFTDVVYRTNHAFEGILKEAYTVLAKQDSSNKRPYEIEQYLADNNIFRPRVMQLFSNYRREWRNPSTHDYQLSFTEQEAFLSILSVSSFVSILLDQMIETAAFDIEKSSAEQKAPAVREAIKDFEVMPLLDRVTYLLVAFSKEQRQLDLKPSELTEAQLLGMLHAFINSVAPEITIDVQAVLQDNGDKLRPDFILTKAAERIVIEVYKYKRESAKIQKRSEQQMLRYLQAANASSGIIFIYPSGRKSSQKLDHIEAIHVDPEHMIVYVRPRPRSQE